MPQMAPLFRRVLRSGPAPPGAPASGGNGYSATYDSSGTPGGAGKKSVIQTTVKGLHGGRGEASRQGHARAVDLERASDSSEQELNGIAVRTAIDQEVSAGVDHDEGFHSGSSVTRL